MHSLGRWRTDRRRCALAAGSLIVVLGAAGCVGGGSARTGSPAFTAADPFRRTPAEHYLDGAAGVAAPATRALRGYTAARVAAAYGTTRRLLIAANLDPQTLRGGEPTAFARLLVPLQRAEFLRGLHRTGVDPQGYGRSTRQWLTSFAPGSTELVGNVIKVAGTMTAVRATETTGRHVLRVEVNYLFVYAVQRPGKLLTRMRVVAHVRGNIDFADWFTIVGPLQPWWLIGGPAVAGARCGTHDGYVHPDFPASRPGRVHPSGAPIKPYDLDQSMPYGGCHPTTGT